MNNERIATIMESSLNLVLEEAVSLFTRLRDRLAEGRDNALKLENSEGDAEAGGSLIDIGQ